MPWTTGCPSLRFERSGLGGTAIVLVHEMGGSLHSWDAMVASLGADVLVLRYDQRGAGGSETPRDAFTLEDQIDDLEQVIATAAIERPFAMVTIAAGAAIGAGYMLRHPGDVSHAAFFAPAFGVEAGAREATIQRARTVSEQGMRGIAEMALARIYPEALRADGFAEYRARFLANDPVGFGHANVAFARSQVDVSRLTASCLLVAGDRDIRPPDAIAAVAATIPRAELEVVEGGGHVLPHQRPVEAASLLRRFMGTGLALFTTA